jgi:acyl carrier protein
MGLRVAPIHLRQFNMRHTFYPTSTRFFAGQLNENEIIELVEGKVFEILKSAAKCKHDKLSRTATFDDLGFDSLDGVELVVAMEEHFGFDLTDAEAEKISSVMDAIQIFHTNYVKNHALAE